MRIREAVVMDMVTDKAKHPQILHQYIHFSVEDLLSSINKVENNNVFLRLAWVRLHQKRHGNVDCSKGCEASAKPPEILPIKFLINEAFSLQLYMEHLNHIKLNFFVLHIVFLLYVLERWALRSGEKFDLLVCSLDGTNTIIYLRDAIVIWCHCFCWQLNKIS